MLLSPEQNSIDSDFDLEIATEMAWFSDLAYSKFEENSRLLEIPLNKKGFRVIKTFNNSKSRTQAYLASNMQYAVLAFRGTECDFMDIITDLKARLKDHGHEGFYTAFESIQLEIIEALEEVRDLPLYLTGHSLGGALAKVAVQTLNVKKIKACYTYGSPAICTKERIRDLKTPVYLLVNSADIVPRSLSLAAGFVVLIIGLLYVVSLIFKLFNTELSRVNRWIDFLKIIGTDTPKYVHFGTIHLLDDEGKISVIQNQKDSENIFMKIATKDFDKSIEDHKMINYTVKLNHLTGRRHLL